MTPAQIQKLRLALGENVKTFAARFHRSGRTVEDWEQGRRSPDALVSELLERLKNEHRDAQRAAKAAKKKKPD